MIRCRESFYTLLFLVTNTDLCDCTETQVPTDLELTLTIFCQPVYSMWLSFPHFDLFTCQFIWLNCQFIWRLGIQIQ